MRLSLLKSKTYIYLLTKFVEKLIFYKNKCFKIYSYHYAQDKDKIHAPQIKILVRYTFI